MLAEGANPLGPKAPQTQTPSSNSRQPLRRGLRPDFALHPARSRLGLESPGPASGSSQAARVHRGPAAQDPESKHPEGHSQARGSLPQRCEQYESQNPLPRTREPAIRPTKQYPRSATVSLAWGCSIATPATNQRTSGLVSRRCSGGEQPRLLRLARRLGRGATTGEDVKAPPNAPRASANTPHGAPGHEIPNAQASYSVT